MSSLLYPCEYSEYPSMNSLPCPCEYSEYQCLAVPHVLRAAGHDRRLRRFCRDALLQCRSAACTAAGTGPSAAGEADRFHLSDLSPPAAAWHRPSGASSKARARQLMCCRLRH
jgi:hypothetical protein